MSAPLPPEVLDHWCLEWASRSLSKNWNPIYRGIPITIENSDELEHMYLKDLEAKGDFYVARAVHAGVGLKEAQISFQRWLCKNDSYWLGKYVLGYDLAEFHLHYPMCKLAEEQLANPGSRTLCEFPRDIFKTTFLNKTQCVRLILNNPNIRILIKSAAEKNATAMLEETKAHFWECDELMRLFPEHIPESKSARGSGVKWTTPARQINRSEGTLNASGVGSTKVSAHYEVIFGDDFWDEDACNTPIVLTKCIKELDNIKYLLQTPAKGVVFLIGTRWAHDDPTEHVSKKRRWMSVIVSGINDKGKSIFPSQMPIMEFYDQADEHLYNFSCQIMLNPRSDDQQFRRSWFRYLDSNELDEKRAAGRLTFRRVLLTDYAADNKAESDYVAILCVTIDNINRKTVVECVQEKLNPLEAIERTFEMADKWQPDMIVYQKAPLEKAILPFIKSRQKERKKQGKSTYYLHPYSLGKKAKEKRMLALQPMFQAGEIYFQRNMTALEEQILDFPHNQSNDDLMDALSELTDEQVTKKPSNTPSKSLEPDEHEDVYLPAIPGMARVDVAKKLAAAEASGMTRGEAIFRIEQAQKIFKRAREKPKKRRQVVGGIVAA